MLQIIIARQTIIGGEWGQAGCRPAAKVAARRRAILAVARFAPVDADATPPGRRGAHRGLPGYRRACLGLRPLPGAADRPLPRKAPTVRAPRAHRASSTAARPHAARASWRTR